MSAAGLPLPEEPGKDAGRRSLGARLKGAWDLEFSNLWWRLLACSLLARLLPQGRAPALRTTLVRAIGFSIGSGTRFLGMPKIQSTRPGRRKDRLRVGHDCTVGTRVILEFGETLTIGDRVTLAEGTVILTTTHELGPKEERCGPAVSTPVTIGNDVEVGMNAIILPGVKLGDGARVSPNSVVNANVAAGVTVSGIPARPLRAKS